MKRVKDWIIRSLGGLTWQDHLEDMELLVSANVRNRNLAVMSARRADEWEKRGRYAEARVKTLESLNDRHRDGRPCVPGGWGEDELPKD